jgi:hypothetical protein
MSGSFLRRAIRAATLVAAVLASPVAAASDAPAAADPPAAAAVDPPDSGFLPDYSLLKPVKDPSGNRTERWVSPKLSRDNYHAIIVDAVVFHPRPQPSSQVSQETLDKISAYLTTTLSNVVLAAVPHATEPGPGVLQVRAAITAVSTGDTSLKACELVPAAFVFSGAMRLAGKRTQDLTLSMEGLVVDSVSGEPLLMVVRQGKGEQIKNTTTPVTVDALKARIDAWAESAGKLVAERLAQPSR